MHQKLQTKNLILRTWTEADRDPFAAMNSDPRVMKYFPEILSRERSDILFDLIQKHFELRGYGPLAAEIRETGAFAGFIGLSVPTFEAHFTPCVEVGWRLIPEFWN